MTGRRKRRKRKPQRAHCIRSYRRIAHQDHGICEKCREEICTGEEYEGSVHVNGVELWVSKEHVYCLPWDVDEYHQYDHDEEEAETAEEEPLEFPEAA